MPNHMRPWIETGIVIFSLLISSDQFLFERLLIKKPTNKPATTVKQSSIVLITVNRYKQLIIKMPMIIITIFLIIRS